MSLLESVLPLFLILRVRNYRHIYLCSDLSLLDFFLRSYLKNIVYKDAPRCFAQLKKKIETAIREIDTAMCLTVFANLLKVASSCLANEGGHFEHAL